MKIYRKSDGQAIHRETVDAHELVATGEYQYEAPRGSDDGKRKVVREDGTVAEMTPGDVKLMTLAGQAAETVRRQENQQAEPALIAAEQRADDHNPVRRKEKEAARLKESATYARRLADANKHDSKLQLDAKEAEERAAEADKTAQAMRKDADAADKALHDRDAKEAKARGEGKNKVSSDAAVAPGANTTPGAKTTPGAAAGAPTEVTGKTDTGKTDKK